jgi:peroxiredoxin
MRLYIFLCLTFIYSPLYALNIGAIASDFALEDTHGHIVKLSDFNGKYVVLEWFNPDCPAVKQHYEQKTPQNLAYEFLAHDVIWLAINSTHYMDRRDNQRWRQLNQIFYRVLTDMDGTVGRDFNAEFTPQIFIINPRRVLVYRGELEVNNVRTALQELLAGQELSNPITTGAGCAVRYPIHSLDF